jgi:hypothetical protein
VEATLISDGGAQATPWGSVTKRLLASDGSVCALYHLLPLHWV